MATKNQPKKDVKQDNTGLLVSETIKNYIVSETSETYRKNFGRIIEKCRYDILHKAIEMFGHSKIDFDVSNTVNKKTQELDTNIWQILEPFLIKHITVNTLANTECSSKITEIRRDFNHLENTVRDSQK